MPELREVKLSQPGERHKIYPYLLEGVEVLGGGDGLGSAGSC